jgi:hypothetical protein
MPSDTWSDQLQVEIVETCEQGTPGEPHALLRHGCGISYPLAGGRVMNQGLKARYCSYCGRPLVISGILRALLTRQSDQGEAREIAGIPEA